MKIFYAREWVYFLPWLSCEYNSSLTSPCPPPLPSHVAHWIDATLRVES